MKRTLLIFGLVGTFFLGACDSGYDRDETITTESDQFENEYSAEEYGYSEEGQDWNDGIIHPVTNVDNTYTDEPNRPTTNTLGNTETVKYMCIDSTLVGEVGL